MRITGIDPRGTTWEDEHPRFEVHFFDKPSHPRMSAASDEYEVEDADVVEVLAWATREAAESDRTFLLHVVVIEDGRRGLIHLAGKDPNAGATDDGGVYESYI